MFDSPGVMFARPCLCSTARPVLMFARPGAVNSPVPSTAPCRQQAKGLCSTAPGPCSCSLGPGFMFDSPVPSTRLRAQPPGSCSAGPGPSTGLMFAWPCAYVRQPRVPSTAPCRRQPPVPSTGLGLMPKPRLVYGPLASCQHLYFSWLVNIPRAVTLVAYQ